MDFGRARARLTAMMGLSNKRPCLLPHLYLPIIIRSDSPGSNRKTSYKVKSIAPSAGRIGGQGSDSRARPLSSSTRHIEPGEANQEILLAMGEANEL